MSRRKSSWDYALIACTVGCLVGLFLVVLGFVNSAVALACYLDWKDSGREYRMQWGAGVCQVHDGKGWVPSRLVRID